MLSLTRTYKKQTNFLFKKVIFLFQLLFDTTFNRTLILFILVLLLILVNKK